MTLSSTEVGATWLENFSREDRQLARKLLDAFVLDSWTSARAKLLELLRDEVCNAKTVGTVWVIPAMDSGDIRDVNHLRADEKLIAFENFHPGMDIPSMPGSEGLIGHLIRDVQGEKVLAPTSLIPLLREKRVRTILVVTDTIETGGQVSKYVQALIRNPTIKSWMSLGWVKIRVVAYAVSVKGEKVLSDTNGINFLRYVRRAPTISDLSWSGSEIEKALSLCWSYGKGRGRLGYGGHAGLFGFQDRVPNTVPRIFRQDGTGWAPLFEGKGGRLVPTGMISELLNAAETPPAHDDLVSAVRQERLSISIDKQQRESNRHILVALALLNVSPQRATVLGSALKWSQTDVASLLHYLVRQGWITEAHSLTPAGAAELVAGKRKPRRVERKTLPLHLPSYYPQSLR